MGIEPLFSMANPDSIHHCHTSCVVAHGTLAGTVCLPASATWWNFVLPLALVLVVTGITVTIHSYRAARSNPTESLKTE